MAFTSGAFPTGYTGNLLVYIEPAYNDAQIVAGSMDAQLTSFATAAKSYSGKIMIPLNEEVNCDNVDPWGYGVGGNTAASAIAAYQHEYTVLKATDPNLIIGYSINNVSCFGPSSLTAYYPGAAYVQFIGLDGFDFGGQTWSQVFNSAITQLQSLGAPIWITSEGAVSADNQSQFITDTMAGMKTYNLGGFMYFNYNDGSDNWVLNSAAISTLQSYVK